MNPISHESAIIIQLIANITSISVTVIIPTLLIRQTIIHQWIHWPKVLSAYPWASSIILLFMIHSLWIGTILFHQYLIEKRLGKTFITEVKHVTGYYRSSESYFSGESYKMDIEKLISVSPEKDDEIYIKIPRISATITSLEKGPYEIKYSTHIHKGWLTTIDGLKIEVMNRNTNNILAQFVESEVKFNNSPIVLFIFPSFFEPLKSWFYYKEPQNQNVVIAKRDTVVKVNSSNFEKLVFGLENSVSK